jgi:hypothetical protein
LEDSDDTINGFIWKSPIGDRLLIIPHNELLDDVSFMDTLSIGGFVIVNPPIDDMPIDGTPIDDIPIDGIPIDDEPIDGTPIEYVPIDDTSIEDVFVVDLCIDNSDIF